MFIYKIFQDISILTSLRLFHRSQSSLFSEILSRLNQTFKRNVSLLSLLSNIFFQKTKAIFFSDFSVIIDRHNFTKPATSFRMYYDRGDLPIKMEYLIGGDKISWTVDIDKLDYSLYLPLFFDGLSETIHPYKTFARQGVQDLLSNGGDKIYAIIPQLIIPIKNALNTKNIEVMCTTLKIIQQLVNASDLIGPGLVPFYRQLLPVFNAYKIRNSEFVNLVSNRVHHLT